MVAAAITWALAFPRGDGATCGTGPAGRPKNSTTPCGSTVMVRRFSPPVTPRITQTGSHAPHVRTVARRWAGRLTSPPEAIVAWLSIWDSIRQPSATWRMIALPRSTRRRPGGSGGPGWNGIMLPPLRGSVARARLALPVRRAELPLEALARRVARDRLGELGGGRTLEVCQPLAAVVDLLAFGGLPVEDHDGLRCLAPLLVRYADHRAVGHRGVTHQDVLHLGRVDVLPARDDHVLDPVVDDEVAVLVQVAGVTRTQTAAGQKQSQRDQDQGPV